MSSTYKVRVNMPEATMALAFILSCDREPAIDHAVTCSWGAGCLSDPQTFMIAVPARFILTLGYEGRSALARKINTTITELINKEIEAKLTFRPGDRVRVTSLEKTREFAPVFGAFRCSEEALPLELTVPNVLTANGRMYISIANDDSGCMWVDVEDCEKIPPEAEK